MLSRMAIALLCTTLFFTSCKKDKVNPAIETPAGEISKIAKMQLDSAFANWSKTFNQADVKPVSYAYKGQLINDAGRQEIIKQIISGNSYVSQYNGIEKQSLQVKQLSAVKDEKVTTGMGDDATTQTVASSLNSALDTLVKVGQAYAEIHWKGNGKEFTSICVFNAQGIVYDNMLSNIILVEDNSTGANLSDQPEAKETMAAAGASATRTYTVVNLTIKGLWPLTHRGWIKVTHAIHYKDGKIFANSCTANGSMTLGSADAKAQNFKRTNGYSQITWAYGWATPTASFKIGFNKGSGKFEASVSGIGSKGSGAGVDTRYL